MVKTRAALRRVARQSPAILHPSATTSMTETVGVLQNLGLTPKHLRTAVVRWPALLTVHPDRILATSTYLANELDFGQLAIASLYRQAPFLLEHDATTRFEPVSEFLQSWGINQTQSVVFAYPRVSARRPSVTPAAPHLPRATRPRPAQVLLADPSTELLPRIRFLIEEVGIDSADIPRVRLRSVRTRFGSGPSHAHNAGDHILPRHIWNLAEEADDSNTAVSSRSWHRRR